jgi:hypothetical protein
MKKNRGCRNWFGLPYVSANVVYQRYDGGGNPVGLVTNLLNAGGAVTYTGNDFYSEYGDNSAIYPETAQPQFQTVEYDFWQPYSVNIYASYPDIYSLPGNPNWNATGMVIYGSETTNWTALPLMPVNLTGNLFFRLRSDISSDGSGLPDWWELEYFGHTGIDPYADPDGDGWNNLQEFQNGTSPTAFNTPPAPQGLTVSYNANNNTAAVNWLPSPGPVTGYTITDSAGNATNVSATATSFQNVVGASVGGYTVTADYAGGNSAASSVALHPSPPNYAFINGAHGYVNLVLYDPPADLSDVIIHRTSQQSTSYINGVLVKFWPVGSAANYPNDLADGDFDIPAASFTNGIAAIPAAQMFSFGSYNLTVQTIRSNGLSSAVWTGSYVYNNVFVDGRAQLKDNLRFRLRAASDNGPFEVFPTLEPTNYVYAGFYDSYSYFSPLQPFSENNYFRNFVFDANNLLTTNSTDNVYNGIEIAGALIGMPATGVFYAYPYDTIYYDDDSYFVDTDVALSSTPGWQADFSGFITTNGLPSAPASVLTASLSQYILPDYDAVTIGYSPASDQNFNGLNCLAQLAVVYTNNQFVYVTQSPGAAPLSEVMYLDYDQPDLQVADYYFARPGIDPLPEQGFNARPSPFSPTNTTPLMIAGVGQPMPQIAGYAKLAVTNGYSGVYGYLGQYFDKAYQITNGVVTTNSAGVLSPYGNFFATQPGAAALVTMPDVDTGQRGTNIVYAISLNMDANHDGNMDLSFNGTDATSQSQPYTFWANNNYDRWDYDGVFLTPEQDDLLTNGVADCNYTDFFGNRIIPDTRDLEDFARLWVCGVTSNLLAALPSGSTVTLSWGDVGSPNPGNPTIDLFQAADADGGIGYLTNETIATEQIDSAQAAYVGRVSPGQSIQLNANFFGSTWRGDHFIWCGVSNGTGGLILTIADASGNVLGQTTAYIQIQDIKNMYERWTVGDEPGVAPLANAIPATEGLSVGASAFEYTPPQNTNTPYILVVHGYNMAVWEKDTYAQTAFKRLYWQGYQGRFGAFNWPTFNNPFQFDASESQAWQSGLGLLNLLTKLNAEYPGNVYLLAHSMGNIVAGEALKEAETNYVVNTYIAAQGAVPAHCYDPTTATMGLTVDSGTPDRHAYYPTNGGACYFNGIGGASKYVNFFNQNDWALTIAWPLDQNAKPATGTLLGYSFSAPDSYYENFGFAQIYFPEDTYEIFSQIIQGRCNELGAQIDVGGPFKKGAVYQEIELDDSPYNFGGDHIFHSAEFRSDNAQRWQFWNQVLVQMGLN